MEMNEKEIEILEILEDNARIPLDVLADMVDLSEEEVEKTITSLEEQNIILNYSSVINWDKAAGKDGVVAMIDVKVTPKREVGFDDVAERIYRFPEVKTVYLMSGAYDLSVQIEGKTMKEVAFFVSNKLSTLDSVLSTTTHFLLKKYKHDGVIFEPEQKDKRIVVSP
ncbi:Lrp/AsnC family transcriptional regulator [Guptibacillus algicola]|uniref:Lrp/AsnC family transcriptional regulator n=1 Tax=Guptibacillus algicola TaxID=225844 RepID=UPI001CD5B537|nr:Lrp/AsnC family transcriptional regulator [Alkalihalobacillus algicola]MCA0988753.1 Lrp/AsnC family transcriptional regulator [Alkalihalobacillus algicola]